MNTNTGLRITVILQESLVNSFFSDALTPGRTAEDKIKSLTLFLENHLVGLHATHGLLPGQGDTVLLAGRQRYRVTARRFVAHEVEGHPELCEVILDIDQFG